MSSGKADRSAGASKISVLPPPISRAVLLPSSSGSRRAPSTSAIGVESAMCGPKPLASLSTSSAGSSPLLQGSACALPLPFLLSLNLLFRYITRQEVITRKDVARTQPTAMPPMIARERCGELGAMSSPRVSHVDVTGTWERRSTAFAGHLVGKGFGET